MNDSIFWTALIARGVMAGLCGVYARTLGRRRVLWIVIAALIGPVIAAAILWLLGATEES